MKIDLCGKIAVVTGASGELGRCMARTLAACAADVVAHYHQSPEKAETLRREIETLSVRCLPVQADITRRDSVFCMKDFVAREWGAADILVNNAVIQYPWTSVLEQKPEDYESQFRSSVLHNVFMAQAFVPKKGQARMALS